MRYIFLAQPPNGWRYLRVGVSRQARQPGVDNAWEQEKPEARKLLENAAESHLSGARFVRQPLRLPKRWQKKDTTANLTEFYRDFAFD